VLAAVKAKDEAALRVLATKDDPDPWRVADELIQREKFDAADAFSKAAPRADVERLPAYVESRRGKSDDARARDSLATAATALAAGNAEEALRALGPTETSAPVDVLGISRVVARGFALVALGRLEESTAEFLVAADAAEAIGLLTGACVALQEAAMSAYRRSDYRRGISALERLQRVAERRGHRALVPKTVGNIGNFYKALGNYPKALECYLVALRMAEEFGDRSDIATTLANIGTVHTSLGNYAVALKYHEQALAVHEELRSRPGVARSLGNIGTVHHDLAEYAKALDYYERALKMKDELGDRGGAALILGNIGNVHDDMADYAIALGYHERALKLKLELGDRAGVAKTLCNIGHVHGSLGNHRTALDYYEQAFKKMEEVEDRAGAAKTLGSIGSSHESLGNFPVALDYYERALKMMDELGDRAGMATMLGNIASEKFRLRDWSGAIDSARRGAALVPFLVAGLGDAQGATARGPHTRLFTVGARAAAEAHEVRSVSDFVERGRAGSLLEAIGARTSLQSGLVPLALATDEAQARAREAYLSSAYRRALDGGDLEATRARRRELDESQAAVEAAVERIQREAKGAANVVHFKPDDLDAIRKRLAPDEALVLYGLFDEGPLALVVAPAGATTVRLPPTNDIENACVALLTAIDERAGPEVTGKSADALRDLVVKPLGLAPGMKRLLVSPDGALSYVPFALLAPDREVVDVPSGTTYGLLLEDGKARGDGVLALGDPDYQSKVDARAAGIYARGAVGKLTRLPATADEAKAVGGTVLLGKDATEKGLRDAVATKPRWRAVHFACHGLIDAERPAFSSLALTADGDDDGFLTVLEVFRAKIPADLVVLSACETAKGKVVKGEGIMGLTRAFMFAGAPRVICSLWKVDDDATRALMTKFYELWNPKDGKPGLPTAEALKQAQEFVKAQEKWKHPYYWAAWVLWGLPD
jgi:CHAT domain-containing protein/Tfp pilus assembly protein PilF